MAATTATTLKQSVLIRAGVKDPNGTIAGSLDAIWDMYSDKALIAPRLQFFYTLADIIDMKIAGLADNIADPKTLDLQDRIWTKKRDAALVEAHTIEKQHARVRTPVSGTLTTTAPIGPADDARTVGALDANDRPYRGDAYIPGYSGSGRII